MHAADQPSPPSPQTHRGVNYLHLVTLEGSCPLMFVKIQLLINVAETRLSFANFVYTPISGRDPCVCLCRLNENDSKERSGGRLVSAAVRIL